jgi:diguanylate cyclase (GGDEF)-like protein
MKLWNHRSYGRIIAAILLIVFIWLLVLSAGEFLSPRSPVYNLRDGWEITKNGELLPTGELLASNVGVLSEQEIIVLSRTLEDFKIDQPCISFYTSHTILDVYLDDEHIYTYGRDYYSNNRSVPRRYNYVALGNDYVGKELKLVISGTRTGASSGISTVLLSDRSALLTSLVANMRNNLMVGIFLISLGLILMMLSPYMVIFHNNDMRLFFSGFASLLLGLYNLSYYSLVDFFTGNSDINTICEYSSLFNVPTALLGYLMSVSTGKKKKLFKALFFINLLVFTTILVLCLSKISRISDFILLLHAMSFVEGLLSMAIITRDYIQKRKASTKHALNSDNVFLFGVVIFLTLSIIDIINYNTEKFLGSKGDIHVRISGFTIGALTFVSSLLISYLLYIISNSNLDSMQSRIASLAFTDPLTGLSNRARCEQVLDMLTEEHASYTVISMDLNKLKQVNDTLGHHEGDRLLSGFATILSDCFWDANLVGRMGGDEFIVVLTEDHALNCTKRIHEFYSTINEWNRKEQVFQYSASYGYAYSYEVPSGSAHEVYMLADTRMYEMKREHQSDDSREVIQNA